MSDVYDALVAGGGIIGAAAGQHLAAAGYRALLAERGDYGGGTSSRTSRLQHCGLGYFSPASHSIAAFALHPRFALQCLELSRRAMRGRNEFVRTSPERVRPIPFLVPLYDEASISLWKARLAFRVMEAFDPGGVSLEFAILDPAEARRLPAAAGLRDLDRLRALVRFTEYQFDWPERIVVDTVMKARDIGLEAHNHTAVTGIEREGEGWRATLALPGGATRSIRAKAVVNAAGVWVDDVSRLADPLAPGLNTGAKGTNIVVRLPPEYQGYGFETIMQDGAPFYVIPWGDLHYLGPKDSVSDGSPEGFRAGETEIVAILAEANVLFPALRLTRRDVLYSWAGVRPRTAAPGQRFGSMEVREHDLTDRGMPNFFVYTGGLLMSHREAGRKLTQAVSNRIKPSGPQKPLDYAAKLLPAGTGNDRDGIAWSAANEQVRTLADLMRGRLPFGWTEDLGLAAAEGASELCRDALGWSAAETREQVLAYRREVIDKFRPREAAL